MPSKVRTEPLRAKDFASGNWTDTGVSGRAGSEAGGRGSGQWAWAEGFVDCTIQTALIFISMDTITQSALATGGDSAIKTTTITRAAGVGEKGEAGSSRSLTAAATHICPALSLSPILCVCMSKELLSLDEAL